ncbi:hypothetical protein D915_004096 [Fasciola hepatica]|uniref:Uncharacterized protein n=1 Tax=Fasciola hepatica TaxID=6192 RepID=A0A4E0RVG3_FASHE|nr:hypothetical protein D915_004096 [Fasciola hepatica]
MSSPDGRSIKRRNRETVIGIRKRERALLPTNGLARPSSATQTEAPRDGTFVRQVLTEISYLGAIRTSAALSGSSHNSLLANYRPLTCSKPSQYQTHRLSQVNMKSRKERSLTGAIPSVTATQNSGRVSQLAGSVEHLVLQDRECPRSPVCSAAVNPHPTRPIFDPTTYSLTRTECSSCPSCDISGVHSHTVSAPVVVLASTQGSPWYRHHRPRAPEPPVSPPVSHKPPTRLEINGTVCSSTGCLPGRLVHDTYHSSRSSSSLGSIMDVQDPHGKSLELLASTVSPVHCDLDLPALEMDIGDQENHFDSDDFPLPPPPDGFDGSEYSSHSISIQRLHRTPSPLVLGPLAPITNIQLNAVVVATRQPKWSTTIRPAFGELTHSAVLDWDPEIETVTDLPPIPSPPPRLVDRLSELTQPPEALIIPTPELHMTSSIADERSDRYRLTRPLALKREAPDGAEQSTPPCSPSQFVEDADLKCALDGDALFGLQETKVMVFHPSFTKRYSNSELKASEYSPKKGRMQLLVPSERSAFLPVSSTTHLVTQDNSVSDRSQYSTSTCCSANPRTH